MERYVRDYNRHELIKLGMPSGMHVSKCVIRMCWIDSASRDDDSRPPMRNWVSDDTETAHSPQRMNDSQSEAMDDSDQGSVQPSGASLGSTMTRPHRPVQPASGSTAPSTEDARAGSPMDIDQDEGSVMSLDPRNHVQQPPVYVPSALPCPVYA